MEIPNTEDYLAQTKSTLKEKSEALPKIDHLPTDDPNKQKAAEQFIELSELVTRALQPFRVIGKMDEGWLSDVQEIGEKARAAIAALDLEDQMHPNFLESLEGLANYRSVLQENKSNNDFEEMSRMDATEVMALLDAAIAQFQASANAESPDEFQCRKYGTAIENLSNDLMFKLNAHGYDTSECKRAQELMTLMSQTFKEAAASNSTSSEMKDRLDHYAKVANRRKMSIETCQRKDVDRVIRRALS